MIRNSYLMTRSLISIKFETKIRTRSAIFFMMQVLRNWQCFCKLHNSIGCRVLHTFSISNLFSYYQLCQSQNQHREVFSDQLCKIQLSRNINSAQNHRPQVPLHKPDQTDGLIKSSKYQHQKPIRRNANKWLLFKQKPFAFDWMGPFHSTNGKHFPAKRLLRRTHAIKFHHFIINNVGMHRATRGWELI